jgi:hypothetical protein
MEKLKLFRLNGNKTTRKCSKCSQVGHIASNRNCPMFFQSDVKETKKASMSTRKCTICRMEGHNKRTCPENFY